MLVNEFENIKCLEKLLICFLKKINYAGVPHRHTYEGRYLLRRKWITLTSVALRGTFVLALRD